MLLSHIKKNCLSLIWQYCPNLKTKILESDQAHIQCLFRMDDTFISLRWYDKKCSNRDIDGKPVFTHTDKLF